MPNYCDNRLTVSGPTSEVMRFINDVDGDKTDLDMARLLPPPEEIRDPDPRYLSREEYDWRVKHWGTKWDIEGGYRSVNTDNGTSQAVYSFWSAWSPIVPFVEFAADKYPDLNFDLVYAEGGMGFVGHWSNDPNVSWERDFDDFGEFCQSAIDLGFETYKDDLIMAQEADEDWVAG